MQHQSVWDSEPFQHDDSDIPRICFILGRGWPVDIRSTRDPRPSDRHRRHRPRRYRRRRWPRPRQYRRRLLNRTLQKASASISKEDFDSRNLIFNFLPSCIVGGNVAATKGLTWSYNATYVEATASGRTFVSESHRHRVELDHGFVVTAIRGETVHRWFIFMLFFRGSVHTMHTSIDRYTQVR